MIASCGGTRLNQQQQIRVATEAELLKAEAEKNSIKDENVTIADSLFAVAQEISKRSVMSHDVVFYTDLAIAHYRVALARHSVMTSHTAKDNASEALKISEEKVHRYKNVLAEIRTDEDVEVKSKGGVSNE
jgi:hypothetical protein